MAHGEQQNTNQPMALCGAKNRTGGTCQQRAGFGTDHVGTGRCKWHGGKNPIRHGRYSKIERPRIAELIADFETDPDPLNMLPELAAARALFVDFIERYDLHTAALLEWYGAKSAPVDSDEDEQAPARPRQVLDIADARSLLAEITKIVKRIEDIRSQNAISRADFYRVMTEMGRTVDLCVEDPEVRQRIHDQWGGIRLA